jgi:hypothetical protein
VKNDHRRRTGALEVVTVPFSAGTQINLQGFRGSHTSGNTLNSRNCEVSCCNTRPMVRSPLDSTHTSTVTRSAEVSWQARVGLRSESGPRFLLSPMSGTSLNWTYKPAADGKLVA